MEFSDVEIFPEGDFEDDHLCEKCSRLDLSPKLSGPEIEELHLDTLEEIMERLYCPFCRLVGLTYAQGKWFDGLDGHDGPVVLKWNAKRGFHFTNDGDRFVFIENEAESPLSPHLAGRVIGDIFDTDLFGTWVRTCEEATCGSPAEEQIATYGKDGLLTIGKDLATTIRDAMTLVSHIGERYLWVDSLCLVQDDDDDKMDGIQKMDLIYEGAILTVVAASGTDYSAGLPGLRPETREVNQVVEEVKPGVEMTAVTALYSELSDKTYMTRGWTFQEFVLSPRFLIFLPDRIHFLCRKSVWSEETIYEKFPTELNEGTGTSQRVVRPRLSDKDPYATFILMLLRYSMRRLTVESDILNAMTGILNKICLQMKSSHLQGLITVCFDLSLLHWNRSEPEKEEGRRRDEFPSWSWGGWTSIQVGFVPSWDNDQDNGEWLEKETYIIWYKRSLKTGVLELVWKTDQSKSMGELGPGDIGYHRRQPSLLFSNYSNDSSRFPTEPTLELPWKEIPRDYPVLQFWAHTITISLQNQPLHRRSLSIVCDSHEHVCGSMQIDDLAVPKIVDKVTTGYEAIILSRARSCRTISGPLLPAPANKPIYWIMLIEWEGSFAEQKGLGFIYQDCIDPSPSLGIAWKEFILA